MMKNASVSILLQTQNGSSHIKFRTAAAHSNMRYVTKVSALGVFLFSKSVRWDRCDALAGLCSLALTSISYAFAKLPQASSAVEII